MNRDERIVRELAKRYADIARLPVQEERRRLWSRKQSLRITRPLLLVSFGMWNVWCQDLFGNQAMQCEDAFLREHERGLRMAIFQHETGDDSILEPWWRQTATLREAEWDFLWGLRVTRIDSPEVGGACRYQPPLRDWSDLGKLRIPHHLVDEIATARDVERISEILQDVLPVEVIRAPACMGFSMDISTHLGKLRGLEQIMLDMYEHPAELHRLLGFMRDGILANQQEAENAGDFSLSAHENQSMPYCEDLAWPLHNSGPAKRRQLWGYSAAQEFTLVSPAMHEEFLLQYQLPILSNFGLTAYGCCENLTQKIEMLRGIPNLRIIAVTPTADVGKCAEQIGPDYVFSWRPNPSDMVCCGFDAAKIRRIIKDGLDAAKGCHVTIVLKDVETVEGDVSRLARWTAIVRSVAEAYS